MNRRAIAKRNAIIQRRYEIKYFYKVRKAIDAKISSLIETVKEGGPQAGMNELSKQIDSGTLPKVIEDLYMKVGLRFARMQWSQFLEQVRKQPKKKGHSSQDALSRKVNRGELSFKGFGFNEIWAGFIKDFLFRFLLEKITFTVSEYTRDVLLNTLQKAIDEGWGVDKIVSELKELPLSRTQAARIVRTEVTRAANTGAMAAGSTFEFEQQKEWIAANDARTRGRNPEDHASHVKLDGTVIDYEDYFTDSRNGDKLRFPGDPGGNGIPPTSPASTCNCRCSVAIVGKTDERGRLIPKKNRVLV